MNKTLEEKRVSILESAESIFSANPFAKCTISDITKAASIADSGFYNYFKNKEDVLFAIPEHHMRRYFSGMEEQLEGINGAEHTLRKLIWYHARYLTNHEEYTRVLLLECRSNPRFYYKSKAYQLIKEYGELIIGVIQSLLSKEIISPTWSPRLVRDMIMGALDHSALNWILKKGPSPLEKAESISELIFNSFRPVFDSADLFDAKTDKAKSILNAAIKAFAEKGYTDTTVNEIARKAQIAEGTIYGYYQSKEDILLKIPEQKLKELLSYIEEQSPEKKLERMLLYCFRFFSNNSDFTSILIMNLRSNRNFYKSKGYQILGGVSDAIADTVREGMKTGIFLKNVHIDSFLDLVFGTIDHIIIPWVMFNRKYDLLSLGEDATRLFINAIHC